jgi:hypothetical protein
MVDVESVRLLQNLMPQQSDADRRLITSLMENGTLFPVITEMDHRMACLDRILEIPRRIVPLYSLCQDTLLLHPCAQSLKEFITGPCKDLRREIALQYQRTSANMPLQVTESIFKSITRPARLQTAMPAYLQLWLYTIRHVESLTSVKLPGKRHDH